jgi:hypothetical protein
LVAAANAAQNPMEVVHLIASIGTGGMSPSPARNLVRRNRIRPPAVPSEESFGARPAKPTGLYSPFSVPLIRRRVQSEGDETLL